MAAEKRKDSEGSGSDVFSPIPPKVITPTDGMLKLPGDKHRQRLYSTDTTLGDMDLPHLAAQMANTRLENLSLLDIFSAPHIVRNTGLVCTIGEL